MAKIPLTVEELSILTKKQLKELDENASPRDFYSRIEAEVKGYLMEFYLRGCIEHQGKFKGVYKSSGEILVCTFSEALRHKLTNG